MQFFEIEQAFRDSFKLVPARLENSKIHQIFDALGDGSNVIVGNVEFFEVGVERNVSG